MEPNITLKEKLSKQPFTLALSSGFFGFFAHYGLILALREAGLKPARTTGSSAGAVLAAALAYDLSNEELKSVLGELKREKFWDPALGFGFLKGKLLEGMLNELFHLRRQVAPVTISTFDIFKRQTKSFSEGNIARAVRASCAVPVMFHPVEIDGRHYWDGGILDKMALNSVAEGETVLIHYLPGNGVHRLYESRGVVEKLSKKFNVIATANLPSVGPYNLNKGMLATEIAFEAASRKLNGAVH